MMPLHSSIARFARFFAEGKYAHINPLFRLYSYVALPEEPGVKRSVLLNYAKAYKLKTFVETGTWMGDTVNTLRDQFTNLYSIELSKPLHAKAKKRFANYKHIKILQGDSAKVLPQIVAKLKSPALFWLDGHYSGGITAKADLDTPIIAELECLLNHSVKGHVILIDDARLFVGKHDYPTLAQVRALVLSKDPKLKFRVKNDSIQIYPSLD